jgi:hypothetical protein
MISFRSTLQMDERLNSRPDLDEYLRIYLGAQHRNMHLTQVITQLNSSIYDHFRGSQHGRVPAGFPWITPVLGSGTVDRGLADGGATLRHRLAEITRVFGDDSLPDGLTKAELTTHIANVLIKGRINTSWDPTGPSFPSPTANDALVRPTALLLLAVALLTRLHDEAMATEMVPVPRWEEEPVVGSDRRSGRWAEIEIALRAPAEEVLRELCEWHDRDDLPDGSAFGAGVLALIRARHEEVKGATIVSLANLRLLTECAWYYLTREFLTYPGWSDVMLELTVDHRTIPHQDGHARPLYDRLSRQAREHIQSRYWGVASESWRMRMSADAREQQPSIHDRIATVLQFQARLQATNRGPAAVPAPAAYVTGFDLELELALLAIRQPFVLAVPVLVARERSDPEVSMLWLGQLVDPTATEPGDELSALLATRNFVLSGFDQFGRSEQHHRGLPVVVRLTGCPAIPAPSTEDDYDFRLQVCRILGWTDGSTGPPKETPQLLSLFVLDEYVSSALGTIESYLDHLDDARLGLPRWVIGTPGGVNARFARFWLVIGAQLGDNSIRQRIVAQLAAAVATSPEPAVRAKRTGLVVNRRIGPLDGRLMQWQGFDIVRGLAEHLLPHLDHYSLHLNQPQVRCDLDCDLR